MGAAARGRRARWRAAEQCGGTGDGRGGGEAVLRALVSVSRVAAAACMRLANLCMEDQNEQLAAEAGAIDAIVAAMQAHPQVVEVQVEGCRVLRNVCCGTEAAGGARKQRVADAGAIEAIVAALQAYPQEAGVQEQGCRALRNVCCGTDAAGSARKKRAAAAGAIEAAAAAMQAHPQVAACRGKDSACAICLPERAVR